jgi:hypothetical protein
VRTMLNSETFRDNFGLRKQHLGSGIMAVGITVGSSVQHCVEMATMLAAASY